MKPREFIAGLGEAATSCLLWPPAGGAQQPALPVIGFLSARSAKDSVRNVAAFGGVAVGARKTGNQAQSNRISLLARADEVIE